MLKLSTILVLSIFIFSGCVANNKQQINEKEDQSINLNEKKVGTNNMSKKLIEATESSNTARIEEMINKGANVNIRDSDGRTPLMIATYNNDIESAGILIDRGADVNIQDNMKNNPLLYAGAEGYIEILKLTIKAGADPTLLNRYGGTALIPASEHGYVNVIEELLTKTDIDVNHVNNLGWTALLEAIILNDGGKRQQETIKLLVEHGADVNIKDISGVSPLDHARNKGFDEIEKILLEAGAKQ